MESEARNNRQLSRLEFFRSAQRRSHPDWCKLSAISKLVNAKEQNLRAQEIADVSNAIALAGAEYWLKVSKYLERNFPEDLDEIIVSGGASRFLESYLEKHYNCKLKIARVDNEDLKYRTREYEPLDPNKHFVPIVWGAGSVEEITNILDLQGEKEAQESLSYRLVDVFGVFDLLLSKNQKKPKKTTSKTTNQETTVS